jgi:hypothetical protein
MGAAVIRRIIPCPDLSNKDLTVPDHPFSHGTVPEVRGGAYLDKFAHRVFNNEGWR